MSWSKKKKKKEHGSTKITVWTRKRVEILRIFLQRYRAPTIIDKSLVQALRNETCIENQQRIRTIVYIGLVIHWYHELD